MTTREDVQKLAALARIRVSAEELPKFTEEFEAILTYVGQLESLQLPVSSIQPPMLRNIFRADENPTEPGTWTEKLASAFPSREGDALAVKQIITHEKSE